MKADLLDCLIVGGGPAGLVAALYLARYRRNVLIYDTFNSRAEKIPLSHNYPGFPQGIAGNELLRRLRNQLSPYKIPIIAESVESLQRENEEKFLITTSGGILVAKNILLCTGVQDIEPQLANINNGIQRGLIRHCPVCDAYEIINKKIAVIGNGKAGLGEALFLRDYTPDVTLITLGKTEAWSKKELQKIHEAKIVIIAENIKDIELSLNLATITFFKIGPVKFDCIYSALGCVKNNKLAQELDAKINNDWIIVNKKQETSTKGFFAAGDIVSGLNQICVATSQAAVAATAIHKRLS